MFQDNIKIYNVGVNPANLAVTPDGVLAYVVNSNNYSIPGSDTVTVLNLVKGHTVKTIKDPSFVEPYRIAIDCGGKYAYVCNSGAATVSIIDLCSNMVVKVINGFDGPGAIVLGKKYAYVTNYGANGGVGSGNGNTISIVDLKIKEIIGTIIVSQDPQVPAAPAALALSPCLKYLYSINYVDGNPGTGTLSIISTKTNLVVSVIGGFSGPFGIALTHDGRYAYVTNFGSNNFSPYGTSVSVVDLKKKYIIKNIEVGIQPAGIVVAQDFAYVSLYNTLYAGANFTNLTPGEGTIIKICLKTKKIVGSAISVGQSPSTLTLSPDESKLYVCKYVQNIVAELCLE